MSGKSAKKLRKSKKLNKKIATACLAMCLGTGFVNAGGDFIVSLYPHFTKPIGTAHNIQSGIGGGVKFTFRPVDYLNVFAQGDYLSLSLPGVKPITLLSGGVGAGYHLSLTDRMALDFDFNLGAYNAKASKSLSGMNGGISLTFTYRLNPVISADVHASGAHYASGSTPLMTMNAGLAAGLSFNLTELFNKRTNVDVQTETILPVFPVLYSWYENNSFGKVLVENKEDSSIQNVTVSFYQPQYMGHPRECASFNSLKKGESAEVDMYAFFNESMLELTEKTDTKAQIIVSYSCLGQKKSQTFDIVVPVYGRNNMSWDDDRRAAVFVSSKDPAALLFAKYITSIVRDNIRNGVPANIQYAMGVFESLDQFGLSYVIDPSSAFSDNVGTSSIDFLQFPYQTLMYRGGDCDDISILVCSLFEAVGIRTAFITIPGHIFMAFDSGLTIAQASAEFTSLDELIVDREANEVWVPLEITLSDEGFNKAWRVGAREWNTAARAGTAAMYKMSESWKTYQPVSVPGASAYFTMPDQKIVAKLFDHSVDQWISREIEPQIQMYEAKLAVKDTVETRNSLGVLYGKYGLFLQADEQFKHARRKGYTPAVINTGNVYFSRQDYTRASKWYKSVLKDDPDNVLALLGVARCAYELAEYSECDLAYARVGQLDAELAAEYSYLGSFVNSKGRAFSLADRLSHTIWSEEKEEVPENVKALVTPEEETKEVLTEDVNAGLSLDDIFDFGNQVVALVPDAEIREEEDLEDYDLASAGSGDGKDPDPDDVLTESPELAEEELDLSVFTQNFTGLASEVSLFDDSDFVLEDLVATEKENLAAPAADSVLITESTQTITDIPETESIITTGTTVADESVTPETVETPSVVSSTNKVESSEIESAVETASYIVNQESEINYSKNDEIASVPVETPAVAEETSAVVVEETPAVVESPVVVEETHLLPVEFVSVEEFVETPAVAVEESPAVAVETPAVVEETPAVVEETPAVVEETPAVAVEETPAIAESPVVVEEAPLEELPAAEETLVVAEETPLLPVEFVSVEEFVETPAVVAVEESPAVAVETPAIAETPAITETPAVVEETSPVAELPATLVTPFSTPIAEPEEIIPMEVPRFTTQPSAEWAPEAAYTADTIPGMKSFEEEMGEFQNEKAFLYADTVELETDPDNDVDVEEKTDKNSQIADVSLPEVNPFSSYLSEEDAKIVEQITNYSLEEIKKEESVLIAMADTKETSPDVVEASVNDTAVETSAETSVETAVEPALETSTETPAEKTIAEEKSEKKAAKKEKSSKKVEKTIVNEAAAGESTSAGEAATAVEAASDGEETSVEIIEETKEENKKHNLPLAGWLAIGAGALAAAASAIFGINKNKKVKKNQE